ncbi:hypothetical protein WCX49_02850 [Sulfurimonas sp. HSL-1656]|uniref:hypothetical protein n=1 Tax=Thiomicrolovo subterrani TaxID=3131934 RepID=UPI0031F7C5E1
MRLFLLAAAFAGLLSAGGLQLSTPVDAVSAYYRAMNSADLTALKHVMEEASYDTEMQIYALSIAFKDPDLRQHLNGYAEHEADKLAVERAVADKLRQRPKRSVSGFTVQKLGKERCSVKYRENGKKRTLYVRKIGEIWKIDYMAGRPTENTVTTEQKSVASIKD